MAQEQSILHDKLEAMAREIEAVSISLDNLKHDLCVDDAGAMYFWNAISGVNDAYEALDCLTKQVQEVA